MRAMTGFEVEVGLRLKVRSDAELEDELGI